MDFKYRFIFYEFQDIIALDYEYDAAGNWIKMEYDYANRLAVVKDNSGNYKEVFHFAPSVSRILISDFDNNQTRFYCDLGGTTLAEYVEQTYLQLTWTKSYTYFGDSLLSTIILNGTSEAIDFNYPDLLGTRTTFLEFSLKLTE